MTWYAKDKKTGQRIKIPDEHISRWKPTLYNYQKDSNGKPVRDQKGKLIPTSPKIQEAGKICPNLMEMEGDLVKLVVKWLSLRNRQSVLQGWLSNPRLQMDGRIGAGRTGLAATHRQKHKVIVNVPKASEKVLLGKEFRSLFICEEGTKIAAGDAAALEGRVQGHYCVPMDTQALTRRGWKEFDALTLGEDILAYNSESGMKEWTPLLEKCVFDNAEVFSIENRNFKVRATANHRWFVEYRNTSTGKYIPKVVETKDLNTCCNIIINAPMQEFQPTSSGILDGKYGINWVERVLSKGLCGVESFMEGFLIADGHYSNQNAVKGGNTQQQGKGRWMFGQNLGEHFNAALTGAYVAHSGYLNVTYRKTKTNVMGIVTLNKKSTITMQRMRVDSIGHERVWCPRTKFGSWVMRQGDVITITGNTYKYDNGATAKELLEGDPHSKTAKSVYVEELEHVDINAGDFSKDDPFFKPFRDKSKNVFYACLPMHTKVLTLDGWKHYEDISIGEKILSLNPSTGNIEEDVVMHTHSFQDKEVVKYYNKFDSFQCTPDHRWYGWKRKWTKVPPRLKEYGFFTIGEANQEHNIILSAPWVGNSSCAISVDEAKFLGWMASDGYWTWSKKSETTSSSLGKKKAIKGGLSQADSKFWKDIEDLLERMGVPYGKYRKEVTNGNTINIYTIKPEWFRPFLDRVFPRRADKHDIDWVRFVLSLSRECLEAFYEGFYLGDGCMGGVLKSEVISQNMGNIFDGVMTAAQLLGNGRLTMYSVNGSPSPMKTIRVQKRKHITCQEISKESLGVMDTFCLTTGNGTFIIWQDDFIGITGNCLYGAGDAKLAATAGFPESRGKEISEKFWTANSATKALKDNLEKYWETVGIKKYVPAIDGRILITRKKSALLNTIFQSCGGIAMDYACCFMDAWLGGLKWKDRKPYYLYKGYEVRRVGYYHDEIEFECEEPIAEEVARMIEKAIAKAGEFLKLNVPLAGEGKVGNNWKETH